MNLTPPRFIRILCWIFPKHADRIRGAWAKDVASKGAHCGRSETMGHGDNAVCGEPYWGKTWQCKDCRIKDLEARGQR